MKKRSPKLGQPIQVQRMSFDEMMKAHEQKAIESNRRFKVDGLCQSRSTDDGSQCKEKGNITQYGPLCDKHLKEVQEILSQLYGMGGFRQL